MRFLLVALLVVGSRAAPVENMAASSATVVSVDLKKPTEVPKNEDPKPPNSNIAASTPTMKPENSIENAPASDINKGDMDKRFLIPGFGLGGNFGGYRGLHGTHGTYANFANIGSYADPLRGYGGYNIGGVGGGMPVNIGLPGAYFG